MHHLAWPRLGCICKCLSLFQSFECPLHSHLHQSTIRAWWWVQSGCRCMCNHIFGYIDHLLRTITYCSSKKLDCDEQWSILLVTSAFFFPFAFIKLAPPSIEKIRQLVQSHERLVLVPSWCSALPSWLTGNCWSSWTLLTCHQLNTCILRTW